MKVLFLARSTLYSVFGGDTVQMLSTAKYLRMLGVTVDIRLAGEKVDYRCYDLLHIFNVIRPGDSLAHIRKSGKPYVVSPLFVDFRECRQGCSRGIRRAAEALLSPDGAEYVKAIGRWIRNGEAVHSAEYLFKGHRNAVRKLARGAVFLLPNSESEYRRFTDHYQMERPYRVVYNGIDLAGAGDSVPSAAKLHDRGSVICVARIESRKNQLNLIRALNGTSFRLKIIGSPAPNHRRYYEQCRRTAAANISFEDFIPHEELAACYREAGVHVLPSWQETCGLSSLEAAYAGCNIVVTDKGDTTEYYGDHAFYCDPASPASIRRAVEMAAAAPVRGMLKDKIGKAYNWKAAAAGTLSVYREVIEIEK